MPKKPLLIRDIEKTIDPDASRGEEVSTSYHASGPGYFDKWWAFIEGREKCWQSRQFTTHASKKKKIIFSNPFLATKAPTTLELEFFNQLIANYDVYLWQGDTTNLAEETPISSADEFWRKRGTAHCATQQQVDDVLTAKGMSGKDYYVLDYKNYTNFCSSLNETTQYENFNNSIEEKKTHFSEREYYHENYDPSLLDISDMKPDPEKLKPLVNLSEITTLKINAKDVQTFDFKSVPNLKKLIIANQYGHDIRPLLNYLPQNIALVIDKSRFYAPDSPSKIAFSPKGIKSLTLNEWDGLREARICNSDELEEIMIKGGDVVPFSLLTIDNLKYLKKLTYQPPKKQNPNIIPKLPDLDIYANSLEELVWLVDSKITTYKEQHWDTLKKLHCTYGLVNQLREQNADLINLEDLNFTILKYNNLSEPLKLPSTPYLKKLSIHSQSMWPGFGTGEFPRSIEEFELKLGSVPGHPPGQLIFPSPNNIKKLKLKLDHPLEDLDLSQLTQLEELVIEGSDIPSTLDLSNCVNLSKVTIQTDSQLNEPTRLKAQFNANLKELTIKKITIIDFELDLDQCPNLESLNLDQCFINICNSHRVITRCSLWNINSDINITAKNVELSRSMLQDKLFSSSLKNAAVVKIFGLTTSEELPPKSRNIELIGPTLDNLDFLSSMPLLETVSITNPDEYHSKNLTVRDNRNIKKIVLDPLYADSISVENLMSLEELAIECGYFNNRYASNSDGTKMSIDQCKKLRSLSVRASQLNELNIQNCSNLENLSIQGQKISSIKIDSLPNLKYLTVYKCQSINPKFFEVDNNVEVLTLEACNLDSLDLSRFHNLKQLNILACYNFPPKLKLPKTLESLTIHKTEKHQWNVDVSECIYLKQLTIYDENVTISGLDKTNQLESIKLRVNNTSLDISHMSNLKSAYLAVNDAETINASNLHQLNDLKILAARLKTIDLMNTNNCKLELEHGGNVQFTGLNLNIVSTESDVRNMNAPKASAQSSSSQSSSSSSSSSSGVVTSENMFELLRLTALNDSSPVACFSDRDYDDIDTMDINTASRSRPHRASGEIKVTVLTKTPAISAYYRNNVISKIASRNNDGNPIFLSVPSHEQSITIKDYGWPPFDDEYMQKLVTYYSQRNDSAVGLLEGDLRLNRKYTLPTEIPQVEDMIDLYCVDKDGNAIKGLELIWDPLHRTHSIQITEPVNGPVKILYVTNHNQLNYKDRPKDQKIFVSDTQLLSDDIRVEIEAIAERLSQLKDQKEPLLKDIFELPTIEEKLEALIEFCKMEEGTPSERPTETMKMFEVVMREKKGVCRHMSRVFMLLAHYLNVPVNMIHNEKHQFCEIPYENLAGDPVWYQYDPGGGLLYDNTPDGVRSSALSRLYRPPASTSRREANIPALGQQSMFTNPHVARYSNLFDSMAKTEPLKSIQQLSDNPQLLPPLIKLNANQTPFAIHTAILKQLSQQEEDISCIYIDKASDFNLYYKPNSLMNGERIKVEGPLKQLIDSKKKSFIVVNWSNFTDTEIASFKSILDTKPTLFGDDLPKEITVVGLQKNNKEACSSFSSRCKPYELAGSFLSNKAKKEEQREVESSIDLFGLGNWRERLYGQIKQAGHQKSLIKGQLIKAVENGQHLKIYNPPINDKEFDSLIHRLTVERKFIYNGEEIKVPPSFHVSCETKVNENHLPKVKIITDENLFDARKHICLGLYNFHECIETTIFNEKREAESGPGYLEQFNTNSIFYVTENIPEADWQYLLHIIKSNPVLKDKNFQFKLAPGVSIQNVASNNNQVDMRTQPVYISNDPDFLATGLKGADEASGKKAIIVDINANTTFNELFASMNNTSDPDDPNKMFFDYTETELFKELKAGTNIILNGEISPILYQQLLPLISKINEISNNQINEARMQINVNGQFHSVQGELKIVQPKSQPFFKKTQTIDLDRAQYRQLFTTFNKATLDKIFAFYDLIRLLPHRGLGRPDKPEVTYNSILHILNRLSAKKRLHFHNPVKGLLSYDYPKNSEDYAFINVAAKMQFTANLYSDKATKETLLQKFLLDHKIKNANDIKDVSWRILNCLSLAQLKTIFPQSDINLYLDKNSHYPTLNKEVLGTLWKMVKPLASKNYQPKPRIKKRLHVDKRKKQLNRLLQNNDVRIIMLKGEAGTGKTFAVDELKKRPDVNVYKADESGILAWLRDESEKPAILAPDEANMSDPGTWNFLKALFRDTDTIYYKGEKFTITPRHKVIGTSNPESYAERQYDPVLQKYSETLYYSKHDDDYIKNNVLSAILPKELYTQDHINLIIDSYHLIQKFNPNYRYSIRDISNIAEHFVAAHQKGLDRNLTTQQLLWYICVNEYAGTIKNETKHPQLLAGMRNLINITPQDAETITKTMAKEYQLPETNDNNLLTFSAEVAIPVEASNILIGICQALTLREKTIRDKDQLKDKPKDVDSDTTKQIAYSKKAFAIGGDPGIGKSTCIETVLQAQGFSKNATSEAGKRYTVISAGSESLVYDEIERAAKEGSIVILDEINIDPDIEKFLKELLDREEASHPGFMLFTSFNAGTAHGRHSVSEALLNRMQVKYMPPYSKQAKIDIAKQWHVSEPEAFATAFEVSSRKHSDINMRTYFTLAKDCGRREPALASRLGSP